MRAVEDAGAIERVVRRLRPLDVELVPRRMIERGSVIRADLGGDVERAEPVARAEAAGRARGARRADERGELAVRDDLARRDGAQCGRAPLEERCLVLEIDGDALERAGLAGEVRAEPLHDFRDEGAI